MGLELIEDDGYTVTCATAKISGFAFDNAGDGVGKLSFDYQR